MASTPPELERWRTAPLRVLNATGERLTGNFESRVVWRAMAHEPNSHEPAQPYILKWIEKESVLAIELACSMAGTAMRLPVPGGCLVACQPIDLPGLPRRLAKQPQVYCFGSELQWPDDSFAMGMDDDDAVEELIWREVCASKTGGSGAAWDELALNPDRHPYNFVFDGARWWLIDHNLALEPLHKMFKRWAQAAVRQELITKRVSENQLANQLHKRMGPDPLHKNASALSALKRRIDWLALQPRNWETQGNESLHGIWRLTEVALLSIALRLPALPLLAQQRHAQPSGAALWNSSSLQPSPPAAT